MTILAYRFSAFGDVTMAATVCREFLEQNEDINLVIVSRENFRQLFQGMPRLHFKGVDLDSYKGFIGLGKLAKELMEEFKPTQVADLHDVIRTKIMNRYFRKRGFQISVIDKGKEEKERLTDIWNLDKLPLKSTVERYADVFRNLGHQITLSHRYDAVAGKNGGIGFAPFAQHFGKMLPLEKSFELVKILAQQNPIYFFGGKGEEQEMLEKWQQEIPNTVNLAGKLSLEQELEKIAELDLMISMDSANMHLASMAGTRCVSIWGSTHHYAGFLGYGQSISDIVEVRDLTCRPCSVFGDKECYRGDYACLNEIHVEDVVAKVYDALRIKANSER